MKRVIFIVLIILLVIGGIGSYFVFGNYSEGYRAGTIIKFSKKGLVYKTWEGQLNLGTIPSTNDASGSMPGSTWSFSVTDEAVVGEIEKAVDSGSRVKLRYNEKFMQFDWVGETKHIVYKVESIE